MAEYSARDRKNYGNPDVARVAYPKFREKIAGLPRFAARLQLCPVLLAGAGARAYGNCVCAHAALTPDEQRRRAAYLPARDEQLHCRAAEAGGADSPSAPSRASQRATEEELAFYDALTKPGVIKDFYTNDVLVAMTRELTDTLRRSRTVDWQRRSDARAKMRVMIRRLLRKYHYPPEGMDDAIKTVMTQCELWADNLEFDTPAAQEYTLPENEEGGIAAE